MRAAATGQPPLGAAAPILDDVIRGWVLGQLVGAFVAQRRAGRLADDEHRRIRDAWGLLGASLGLVVGLLDEVS